MTNRRTVAILRCLRSLTCYRRKMVGYAGSPKRTVYVGVTLTLDRVKVTPSYTVRVVLPAYPTILRL